MIIAWFLGVFGINTVSDIWRALKYMYHELAGQYLSQILHRNRTICLKEIL